MDIAQLSSALSLNDLQSQYSVGMLSKSLDDSQTSASSLVQMMDNTMELSVNPSVGGNLDLRV